MLSIAKHLAKCSGKVLREILHFVQDDTIVEFSSSFIIKNQFSPSPNQTALCPPR